VRRRRVCAARHRHPGLPDGRERPGLHRARAPENRPAAADQSVPQEEARLSVARLPQPDRPDGRRRALVVDVGGGSTSFSWGRTSRTRRPPARRRCAPGCRSPIGVGDPGRAVPEGETATRAGSGQWSTP
jgi:hypothetical protein